MSRKQGAIFMGLGILAGLTLSGPAVQAADYLTARPSSQPIYVDGLRVSMTAYNIGARNFSFGTTILLPILNAGNPSARTSSYAPARLIPSTAATSGAESISGSSS